MSIQEPVKAVGDLAAISVTVGTVAGVLPALAAVLTIVWTALRIYESPTVQSWLARCRKPPA